MIDIPWTYYVAPGKNAPCLLFVITLVKEMGWLDYEQSLYFCGIFREWAF